MIVAELEGTGTEHIGFPLVSAQVSIRGYRNVDKKREEDYDNEIVNRECQCIWDKIYRYDREREGCYFLHHTSHGWVHFISVNVRTGIFTE